MRWRACVRREAPVSGRCSVFGRTLRSPGRAATPETARRSHSLTTTCRWLHRTASRARSQGLWNTQKNDRSIYVVASYFRKHKNIFAFLETIPIWSVRFFFMTYRQNSKGMKRRLCHLLTKQGILPSGMTVQWLLPDVNDDCNITEDCLKMRKIHSMAKPMTALLSSANSCVGIYVNSLAPEKCGNNFRVLISNSFYELISGAFPVKLFSGECHRTPLMIS